MSTPFTRAMTVYESEPCVRTFWEDVTLHYCNCSGFVFATPEFFIMGRAVLRSAPAADIVNPAVGYIRGVADCWHVALACGDLSAAWSILPWPMDWMSFERKNELRFHRFADVQRLTHYPPHEKIRATA